MLGQRSGDAPGHNPARCPYRTERPRVLVPPGFWTLPFAGVILHVEEVRRVTRPSNHEQNYLLAALSSDDYKRLSPGLRRVKLPLGKTIQKAKVPLAYAYFPTTSIVSMVSEMRKGEIAEIAITGNDGMVGTPLLMGGSTSPTDAIVQCAGHAYRLTARALRTELDRNGALRNLTMHYTQALMTQMAQTVVCNRHHS